MRFLTVALTVSVAALAAFGSPLAAQQRPLTFMDVQELKRAGSWTPSPDGAQMLYTVTTPDWEAAESQTDIHLVSLSEGVPSSRQLTYTDDKNETSPGLGPGRVVLRLLVQPRRRRQPALHDAPRWRRGPQGDRRRPKGVSGFAFSPDGQWLVYRSGESDREQLYRLPAGELVGAEPEQLTDGDAGVDQWDFSPDGSRIYFTRPDSFDEDEVKRLEQGFTVDVRNAVTPLSSLWSVDVESATERRETNDASYSVNSFTLSDDGRWIGITGGSPERYERNITAQRLYADLYLKEIASGEIERLTDNYEIGEGGMSFSPDGRWIAFSAPDDMERYSMTENRVYIREVEDRGGAFRKLGADFDQSSSVGFWSGDSETIYFNAGVTVTTQLHALDVETVRCASSPRSGRRSRCPGTMTPAPSSSATATRRPSPTVFTVASVDDVPNRSAWTQLVDVNPHVRDIALGDEVEVNWRSSDGKMVGGVLVYPVGYEEGTRYPLIVAIHGGPASADILRFNGGYNAQVYAGAGYAVLKPNYRGSRNYGNAHRTDIVGDYFTMGYEDIITGVDHLIAEGIVDGDRMGALGWSAGGHWSNWILTQTDRFKAISSGAGTMNWISMYAQSDVQRNRQFYVGDGFLYEDFDTYFDQSPLKYITNAVTPTMIHVVEGDPRVPSPQSVELHMALKKLDVPTELFMYPGRSHGIPDPRNRLVKAVSEMAWMDYYVRGIGEKFEWRQVLETLEAEDGPVVVSEPQR